MVTYTRKQHISIGNIIKKLPKKKRMTEYRKWNKTFKRDNPRYIPAKFKKHIGL